MKKTAYCLIVGSAILASGSELHAAQTILQHSGSNDPTTEGWVSQHNIPIPSNFHATVQTAPITDDAGTGINAWSIGLSNPKTFSDFQNYASSAWKQREQDISTYGWMFTVNCRFASIAPGTAIDFFLDISDPGGAGGAVLNSGYSLLLYGDAQGVLHPGFGTLLGQQSPFTLPNPFDYHQYQIVFDPVTQTANLSVDGTTVLSNVAPNGGSSAGLLQWGVTYDGSNPSALTTQANFNLVQFDVVPEPTTLALLTLGAVSLLAVRRR